MRQPTFLEVDYQICMSGQECGADRHGKRSLPFKERRICVVGVQFFSGVLA